VSTSSGRLPRDYWTFWTGQTISSAGSAVTAFAMPLLVYDLTGSAFKLGLTVAAVYVPYALFGLPIGAWVDRVDRKRLMIFTDLLRALLLATVPAAAALDLLTVWWLYAVTFATSTLGIAFNSASFAAIRFLVSDDRDLAKANGRLQAGFSAAALAAPALGGLALTIVHTPTLILIDAASFVLSAASISLVRRAFQVDEPRRSTTLLHDIGEGLRYVLGNPLLRALAIMAAAMNFFLATTIGQIVLLAKHGLGASDSEVGWFFSAGSAGVIVFALLAPAALRLGSYGQIVIAASIANGVFTILLAEAPSVAVGLIAYAGVIGMTELFGINTASVRQEITPPHLLGRVISTAMVLAWSIQPVGAVVGGIAIEQSGSVRLVYAVAGAALIVIGLGFAAGALGHSSLGARGQRLRPPGSVEP
jgi:MFS family permease